MVDTTDTKKCAETFDPCTDISAGYDDAQSPFYRLNYHFGMLLGVDDFATEQLYHHGKMRLHNAWLHGAGVVWGFGVKLDEARGEIHVEPGLALDASGQELYLDVEACVNVVEWFLAHKDDEGFKFTKKNNRVTFNAHVEIRFKSCLTRQVPALNEPCGSGNSGGTAYSRVFETVDIQLVAEKAVSPPAAAGVQPYHRVRILFGLEEPVFPEDQSIVDARDAILSLPYERQPSAYREALGKFAALDEIDLKPATRIDDDTTRLLYPAPGDFPLILAEINGITLEHDDNSDKLKLKEGEVDVAVRSTHIPTAIIQELLCGPLFNNGKEPSSVKGPRVDPESVNFEEKNVFFNVSGELHPQSVTKNAFVLSTFDIKAGWKTLKLYTIELEKLEGENVEIKQKVTIKLNNSLPDEGLVRLIVHGEGPHPVLGTNLVPLAGAITDPPPTAEDAGRNFIFMRKMGE